MADNSTFKVTFTIDLAPYAEGLKGMLTMTESVGAQLKPILAGGAANLKPIEQELDRVTERLRLMGLDAKMSGGEVAAMGDPIESTGEKAAKSTEKFDRHGRSITGVKREASDMMMAMGFLAMALSNVGDSAASQSKDVQKATGSLREGMMAGFGFTTMLMMIPGIGQAAALGIGLISGAGIGLMKFFDDSEEKAKQMARSMELFNRSLKGASTEDLDKYRQAISETITTRAKYAIALDQLKRDAYLSGDIYAGASFQKQAADVRAGIDLLNGYIQSAEKELQSRKMTESEVAERVKGLAPKKLANKYDEMRAEAKIEYYKAIAEINESDALDGTKQAARHDLAVVYSNKRRQILQDELAERDTFRASIKAIEMETARIVMDVNEKKELSTAKTENERLAITEHYALKRVDMEQTAAEISLKLERERLEKIGGPEAKKRISEIDEQLNGLQNKFDMSRAAIREGSALKLGETPEGSIAAQEMKLRALRANLSKETTEDARRTMQEQILLEEDKLARMTMSADDYYRHIKSKEEEKRQQWRETHQTEMGAIGVLKDGFRSAWDMMLGTQRQATNAIEALWMGIERSALDAIGNVLDKFIESALIEQEMSVSGGGAAAAGGGGFNPLNAIMSLVGILGFDEGGELQAGKPGYFEGRRTEIIAPKETFIKIARDTIVPEALKRAGASESGGSDVAALASEIRTLARSIKDVKLELRLRNGDLYAASKLATEENNKRKF